MKRHPLRSYGPVAAVAVSFLLMAATVDPAVRAERSYVGTAVAGGVPSPETGDASVPGGVADGDGGSTASVRGTTQTAGTGVQPCPDRDKQVPGDPYSPPCVIFSGDNGGVTYQGVTDDEIVIAVRELEGPSAAEIFSQLSGESVSDSPEAFEDTGRALADYFSTRFNFYGRKIKLVIFKGSGNGASELLGGGKERALADAVRADKEVGAFADISGITIPYADALAKQGIVNLGAPYPSRKWFVDRRPYAWSFFPDGTRVVEASSSAAIARLSGKDSANAEFGGPDVNGKPRKYAIVAPENAEYQQSVNEYRTRLAEAGIPIELNMKYKLDINSMPNQASNIIAQMKDAGVTSVFCGCDPVMLALGLAPKANEQDYEPEWITSGLAFVEQDIVAQLIDPKQWRHSFGIAFNAEPEVLGASYAYNAYKQMRPNDEPAFGVDVIYYQLYMLAIGLQMAGPNLTPETFEAGMFAYPGGTGPQGTWRFGPGDYTPAEDFREIWWDPNRISRQNNKAGAWVELNGGRRYFPGGVPVGRAPYFEDGR
ncbi:MAG: ABC transporter substrate-binding protein [Acidimicrobiales bacterium]